MSMDRMNDLLTRYYSLEDTLRDTIDDSDLMEIICLLDFISQESGINLKAYKADGSQYYPVIY